MTAITEAAAPDAALASTADAAGWLAVVAGGQPLLLPLGQCGEVHTSAPVQRLAHTKPWLLGVANLRGQVAAVVDLASHLGVAAAAAAPAPAALPGAGCGPLVALPAALGVPAALLVGALKGMRQRTAMQPSDAPCPAWAEAVWQDEQGQAWHSVDLAQMTRQIGFIDVAA